MSDCQCGEWPYCAAWCGTIDDHTDEWVSWTEDMEPSPVMDWPIG